MKSGKLITFEGIDGCGKSTQIDLARNWLQNQGYMVLTTFQPGGTLIGRQIRQILLNPENRGLVKESEMMLYLADRIQHLKQVILPAVKQGKLVLCDRFHDSTLAYQGNGRGINMKMIQSIENESITPFTPNLTFLLIIEPREALRRINAKSCGKAKRDRLEEESLSFFERVTAGYVELASASPQRFVCLDGSASKEEVHQKIIVALKQHI